MSPIDPQSEDWSNSFDDHDSSYWEAYLGGPEDEVFESSVEPDYDDWESSIGSNELFEIEKRQPCSTHVVQTNHEERFPTFWSAKTAAAKLEGANATISKDGNDFVVRFSWPINLPLPKFRVGQRYTPEEIAFIEDSYANWLPISKIADQLHRTVTSVEGRLHAARLRYHLRTLEETTFLDFDKNSDFWDRLLRGDPFTFDQDSIEIFSQLGLKFGTTCSGQMRKSDFSQQQLISLLSSFLNFPIYPLPEKQMGSEIIRAVCELAIQCGFPIVGARLALQVGHPELLIRALKGVDNLPVGWKGIRARTLSYLRFDFLKHFPGHFEKFQKSLYRRRHDYSVTGYFCEHLDFQLSEIFDNDDSSSATDLQAIISCAANDLNRLSDLARSGNKLAAWFAADLRRQSMWRNDTVPLDADREYLQIAGNYRPSTEELLEILRAHLPFDESNAAQISRNIHS